jgi:hypothetical protein
MSDAQVRAAIDQMEAWLGDSNWEPDAEALARWNAEFQKALVRAEKAPGWPDLIARAHAAGQLLEARAAVVAEARDQVRAEIETLGRGNRALKGYGTSTC